MYSHLKLYIPYNEKIKVVCDYLAKTDIHALEVGKYDIADGVRVVVNAFTPKTREAARWETHRKYIDLQYLIEGDESMGYLPIDEVEDAEYDAEKDVSHPVPKAGANVSEIALETGSADLPACPKMNSSWCVPSVGRTLPPNCVIPGS